ncbi:anaphase-promoting complex subunit 5-domain-containing protein [Chytridium lagenaria]|nr:anaphase-promoting complex subunit 5-domain-containing protein [Chytridium lagenaria]
MTFLTPHRLLVLLVLAELKQLTDVQDVDIGWKAHIFAQLLQQTKSGTSDQRILGILNDADTHSQALHRAVKEKIVSFATSSTHYMHDLFTLFQTASTLIDMESATSELGIFIRKALVDHHKMDFDTTSKLGESFVKHAKSQITDSPPPNYASIHDLNGYFSKSFFEKSTTISLPPSFDVNITLFRSKIPNSIILHYATYVEASKKGDYERACEALRRFFEVYPAESDRKWYQYALLEMAILQSQFRRTVEARWALNECIQTARRNRDHVCTLYAKTWLLELSDDVPTVDFLMSLATDARKLELWSIECHFWVKAAEMVLREGDGPDNVFYLLERAEGIEFEREVGMEARIRGVKAKAWNDFGGTTTYFPSHLIQHARNGDIPSAASLLLTHVHLFPSTDVELRNQWICTALTVLMERSLERGEAMQCAEILRYLRELRTPTHAHKIEMDVYAAKIDVLRHRTMEAYKTLTDTRQYAERDSVRHLRAKVSIDLDIAQLFIDTQNPLKSLPHLFSEASASFACTHHHPLGAIHFRAQILVARVFAELGDPFRGVRVLEDVAGSVWGCGEAALRGDMEVVRGVCYMGCLKEVRRRRKEGKEKAKKKSPKIPMDVGMEKFLEEFREGLEEAVQKDALETELKEGRDAVSIFDFYVQDEAQLEELMGISESTVLQCFENAIKEYKSIESLIRLRDVYARLVRFHEHNVTERLEAISMRDACDRRVMTHGRFLTERVGTFDDVVDVLEGIVENPGGREGGKGREDADEMEEGSEEDKGRVERDRRIVQLVI